MKIYFIFIFIFVSCTEKKSSEDNSDTSIAEQIQTSKPELKDTQNNIQIKFKSNDHYLAIGYFDDQNHLEKIERFFNGKLINE